MSKWRGGIIRSTQITPGGSDEQAAASGVWRASDAAYWVKQGSWPSGMTPDTYFPNTTLLLNGDSVNAGQNNIFVDGSSVGSPITRYGNATQGSFTPFGSNWSAYFDGSGDYLQTPASSATTIVGTMNSSTNLTIECWINPTAYNNNSTNFPGLIGDMNPTSQVDYWSWGLTSTGTLMLYWYISGSQYRAYTTGTVSLNTWSHIALNISAGAITMYINGVSQAISGTSTLGAVSGSVGYITVGQWNNAGSTGDAGNYTGYISNLRIVKASTYTTSFTPSTTPLTAITSTSLLTCHANRFVDGSSNATTLTRAGNTKITNFSPFSTVGRANSPTGYYNQNDVTNWSNYFSSGNYLTLANSTALTLSGGTYTIEMWIYPNGDYGNYNTLIGKRVASSSSTAWEVYLRTSTGVLSFYNGTNYESSVTPTAGMWSHVAAVYDGTYMNLYLNGTRVLQSAITNSDVSASTYIGTYPSYDERFIGYMSNLRITKGAALYSGASFTPPTEPLTTSVSSGTVSLLTCQSRAYVDNSTNSAALTVTGQPLVSGFSPFNTVGYNSVYFDGSGDYISAAGATALTLGTGDFTIEMWLQSGPNGDSTRLAGNGAGGAWGANKWVMGTGYSGNSNKFFISVNGGTVLLSSTTTFNNNVWRHVAVTRSGNTWRLFIDGIQEATTTNTSTFDGGVNADISIGSGRISGDAEWAGYISNFRIVKGTALYTSNFTPSTTPLTAVTNTSLLTCQNSSFKDNSTNAFTISRTGDAKTQTYNPFFSTTALTKCGSMYFDGTGDYIRAVSGPAFALGTGDFTVEMWAYFMDTGATNRPLFDTGVSTNTGRLLIRQGNDTGGVANVVNAYLSGVTASSPTFNFFEWVHVAVVRSSGTLKVYINGIGGTGVSATANVSENSGIIGAFFDQLAWNFTGFITDVRVTKAAAVYTTNFTPPTAPVTPTAATTFYVNGMNGAIADQTGINNLQTVGDTKISTSIKKYGTGSIYMDGSGDYLTLPTSENFHFASSNFTMEGWFYFTSGTTNAIQTIFSNYTTFGNAGSIFWGKHTNNSGYVTVWFSNYSTGGPLLAESSYPSNNTWTHYALVRNGNTFTLYRDGVSTASASWSGAATSAAAPVWIGTNGDGTQYPFPGYIDDFRITKGVARYTSAFTPPTSAHATR